MTESVKLASLMPASFSSEMFLSKFSLMVGVLRVDAETDVLNEDGLDRLDDETVFDEELFEFNDVSELVDDC